MPYQLVSTILAGGLVYASDLLKLKSYTKSMVNL